MLYSSGYYILSIQYGVTIMVEFMYCIVLTVAITISRCCTSQMLFALALSSYCCPMWSLKYKVIQYRSKAAFLLLP